MTVSTQTCAWIFYEDDFDKHESQRMLEVVQQVAQQGACAFVYHVNPWGKDECPFGHYVVATQPLTVEQVRLRHEAEQEEYLRTAVKECLPFVSNGDKPEDILEEVFGTVDILPDRFAEIAEEEGLRVPEGWVKTMSVE